MGESDGIILTRIFFFMHIKGSNSLLLIILWKIGFSSINGDFWGISTTENCYYARDKKFLKGTEIDIW